MADLSLVAHGPHQLTCSLPGRCSLLFRGMKIYRQVMVMVACTSSFCLQRLKPAAAGHDIVRKHTSACMIFFDLLDDLKHQ